MGRILSEPGLFKFENIGDEITGKLVEIETITMSGKATPKFLLEQADGELLFVLGTEDLKKKIRPCHVGLTLRIEWIETERINGFDMRRFEIEAL